MSAGNLKIETYVPETDIGKITVGQQATVTLDAYGPQTPFTATVSHVDPAPTVQNGINGYKVTIHFPTIDARIKSGMTANITITTQSAQGVLVIPSRAIITRGTDKFVLVKNTTGFTEQKVSTGISSADGYTEVDAGLHEGDIIAGFGTN